MHAGRMPHAGGMGSVRRQGMLRAAGIGSARARVRRQIGVLDGRPEDGLEM